MVLLNLIDLTQKIKITSSLSSKFSNSKITSNFTLYHYRRPDSSSQYSVSRVLKDLVAKNQRLRFLTKRFFTTN